MLSKISRNLRRNPKFASFSFSESSQSTKNSNENEETGGRKTQADAENENFETEETRAGPMKWIWRIFWWGSISLFGYNFYLLKYSTNPFSNLGYQSSFFNGAKYVDSKFTNFYNFMTKPPMEKLLPDFPQIPGMPMEPPKTLVLNLSGTLIHTNYALGKGMEIMKRPGLKQFLNQLAGVYEIVIFSDEDTMFTYSIAERLDPKRMFLAGCFGREAASFQYGKYIKDLKYLNRDIKKVVVLEVSPDKIALHKENGIFLQEFQGDKEDKALFELLPFLQHLGKPEIKDVRQELKKYGQYNPGKKFLEELKQRQKVLSERKGMAGIFRGMTGRNPQVQPKN